MASNTTSRFLATAIGHLAIVAGAAFLALWMKGRADTRLLIGGVASLVCGVGIVTATVRASMPPNTR